MIIKNIELYGLTDEEKMIMLMAGSHHIKKEEVAICLYL